MESINRQISIHVNHQQELQSGLNNAEELLEDEEYGQIREDKLISRKSLLIRNNPAFAKFQDWQDYIKTHTTLAELEFDPELSTTIQTHGRLNVSDDLSLKMPNITFESLRPSSLTANGYLCSAEWTTTEYANNNREFLITYCVDNDREEKHIQDQEWKTAEHKAVETSNDDKFAVDIEDLLMYDKSYKFCISSDVCDPISINVPSNILEFGIRTMQIPLQVGFYLGHWSDYHPANLLKNRDMMSCYYASQWKSKFDSNENDWIIFKYDELYLPNKVMIKNRKNDNQAVKTFRLFIGDGEEWYLFNPAIITAHNKNEEYQSFVISGIDYSVIKIKQLKQIKVEFMTNHGCNILFLCRFVMRDLKLFGVK